MKLNPIGNQAYKLVKNLAIARRSNNFKREEKAYDKLYDWCIKNNIDMSYIIQEIKKYMASECIADCMNGYDAVI